jgi:DNA/RNA-binding domain of Phe-tRNA-synthetase-like protein
LQWRRYVEHHDLGVVVGQYAGAIVTPDGCGPSVDQGSSVLFGMPAPLSNAMTSTIVPSIDPDVLRLAPGFRALSLIAESRGVTDGSVAIEALAMASTVVAARQPAWADAHLDAWRQVFQRFGAKAQRTPSSAEALRKRFVRDGALPQVNPVVDLYNAISLRFAVPVGGENLGAYAGPPRLVRATGTEVFDTMKDGQRIEEHPDPGEVVWRDDLGVTCRRWNWRQGVRTRLDGGAHQMWFILESLPEMPIEALHEAGDELASGLRAMMADVRIESTLIGTTGR